LNSPVSAAQRAFLGRLSLGLTPRIVDVGANVGDWSLAALDRWPRAQIVAVEANPAATPSLERASGGRFEVINKAVVGKPEEKTRTLYYDWNGKDGACVLGSFHRTETFIPGHVVGNHEVEVECTTLFDVTWRRGTFPTDLLKLDVEGSEFEILEGAHMAGILSPLKFKYIEWEYNQCAVASHTFVNDFWELLSARGYAIGVMREDGSVEHIPQYDMALEHVTPAREFVACSPEAMEALA
jgi:FkbM family methyltransferase